MNKLRLIWKYRKDIIKSLERIETETVTPKTLGWNHWGFVAGKKPAIYKNGEPVTDDISITGWFKF
jgi:hypothetical protein